MMVIRASMNRIRQRTFRVNRHSCRTGKRSRSLGTWKWIQIRRVPQRGPHLSKDHMDFDSHTTCSGGNATARYVSSSALQGNCYMEETWRTTRRGREGTGERLRAAVAF
jgi:hypothetical protein